MNRTNISGASPYESIYGFSRAVLVEDRIIVAGTAPIWPDGEMDPDPAAQARRCIEIMVGRCLTNQACVDNGRRGRPSGSEMEDRDGT